MLPAITKELEFPSAEKKIKDSISFIESEALFDYENSCLQYDMNGNVMFGLDSKDSFGNIIKRGRAITAFIEKIFRTEINCFAIYEKDEDGLEEYGSKFHLFIGFVFPYDYIKPLFIKEFERCIYRLEEIENVLDGEVKILGTNGTIVETSGLLTRYSEASISLVREVLNG